MLSYGRGYSPPYDGVWFACGHIRGYEAEAARLPVPAGRSTKTLLTVPKRSHSLLLARARISSRALVSLKDENMLMQSLQFLKNPFTGP